MSAPGKRVCVVGCTGAVGKEMIRMLDVCKYPVWSLSLLASSRSLGKVQETPYGTLPVEEFSVEKARASDVVLMAVSGSFALEFAPQIIGEKKDGPLVIDNSSAFRMDPNVPLVIPEINAPAAKGHKLISNPNCTTAIAAMALWPLHCHFGIRKLIVSTYQAASGAGQEGMDELLEMTRVYVNESPQAATNQSNVFAHPLPFNVIPHIDTPQANGYTKEEMKVQWETRKIFGLDDDVRISCTAVRVPTLRAHAEAITLETVKEITPEAATQILSTAPGLKVSNDLSNKLYPMPLTTSGDLDVHVGRIRQSEVFGQQGLDLFVCGDQLLRGAALNAVLIALAVDSGYPEPVFQPQF
eukprot:c725_g1_i1.p1 GENE.c725_g1_i1~~c725_g1_i1.p1  ORF type:complete len:367 (-),score=91.43 c725_g1_i1:68-1132(-)